MFMILMLLIRDYSLVTRVQHIESCNFNIIGTFYSSKRETKMGITESYPTSVTVVRSINNNNTSGNARSAQHSSRKEYTGINNRPSGPNSSVGNRTVENSNGSNTSRSSKTQENRETKEEASDPCAVQENIA